MPFNDTQRFPEGGVYPSEENGAANLEVRADARANHYAAGRVQRHGELLLNKVHQVRGDKNNVPPHGGTILLKLEYGFAKPTHGCEANIDKIDRVQSRLGCIQPEARRSKPRGTVRATGQIDRTAGFCHRYY